MTAWHPARALDRSPAAFLRRSKATDDSPDTGLNCAELRALLDAAAADGARSAIMITQLAPNGLRIDKALLRDVEHSYTSVGHRGC